MSRPSSLSGAEALAASAAAMLAVTIVAAYLLDRAGIPIRPIVLLPVMAGSGAGSFFLLGRRVEWRVVEVFPFVAIVGATFGWLIWIAGPSFLPLGSGSDLTHHLLLIQYIEQHWQFVHDRAVETFLGEMASYTPGGHLLAALAGAWTGTDGFHALHAVVAGTVALKVGFVFLIALRVMESVSPLSGATRTVRVSFALIAVALLFASPVYFLRSFVENSFVAQVVSELFAVVMWWSLVAWDGRAGRIPLALFGVAGAASFLTWPVWIGPPTVAAFAVALLNRQRSLGERVTDLAFAYVPIAVVASLYMATSIGGRGMAGTSGAAPWPAVDAYGRWFVALSVAGVALAATRRAGRVTALLVLAIGAQAAALYVVAGMSGAETPYLALKMFYLLLYPQAVAAALALAVIWCAIGNAIARAGGRWGVGRSWQIVEAPLACLLVGWIGIVVARPLAGAPRSLTVLRHAAVSEPLAVAGQWARAHVPPNCVEYLVDGDETAYWLHLAVLGNPRISARSVDSETFEHELGIVRWLTPGGLPYAIADLPALPRGVRDELDIVQQFGTAAVVRRRGPSSCAAQR